MKKKKIIIAIEIKLNNKNIVRQKCTAVIVVQCFGAVAGKTVIDAIYNNKITG